MSMIIYKTTNLVNGKIYVGKDAYNRSTYLGSGLVLRRAIAKYGKENFKKEILERCQSLNELSQREIYWISFFNSTNPSIGYNLTDGGVGGDTYSFLPEYKKTIRKKQLADAAKAFNNSEEGKKFLSENSKRMWRDPKHRSHMVKVMSGRKVKWKDKIASAITEWHKTDPIPLESRQRAAKICRQKMTGKEFKSIPPDIEQKIIKLYQTIGPRLIEKETGISRYLIVRLLKKKGIYQKWQKGIGEKSLKLASLSRCGDKNPMAKHST